MKIRIAVAISPDGTWNADGDQLTVASHVPDREKIARASEWLFEHHGVGHVVIVEAEVPMPQPALVIEGTVLPSPPTAGVDSPP